MKKYMKNKNSFKLFLYKILLYHCMSFSLIFHLLPQELKAQLKLMSPRGVVGVKL